MGKQQQTKIELDNRSHINAFKTNHVATKLKNYSYLYIGCRWYESQI